MKKPKTSPRKPPKASKASPKASVKKTSPKASKASAKKTLATTSSPLAAKRSSALTSWLEHPRKALRETFGRALDRAQKSAERLAGVAVGRKRLEIRHVGDAWTVVDPKSGEELAHIGREKRAPRVKSHSGETPTQFKRRMSREIDRDSKRKAREARTKERRELVTQRKQTRQQRTEQLRADRTLCRKELDDVREKVQGQPARRIAVAKTRTGCAVRAQSTEEAFGAKLDAVLAGLQKVQSYMARPKRTKPRKTSPAPRRVDREERDDAVRSELERRDLAHLVPIWEEKKHLAHIRDASADRAIERFLEAVEEDSEALQLAQQRAEHVDPADLACEEAQYFAREGDPQAVEYSEQHCDGPVARRGSPHTRTVLMYHDVPAPPEPTKKRARAAKEPRPHDGPLRGQQSFASSQGASFLARRGPQLTF